MNIQFQMGGFLFCLFLFIVYTSRKRLSLYSEKIFYYMMITTLLLLTVDMLSVWAIVNREGLSPLFVSFICKLYLCFLIFDVGVSLVYVMLDILKESHHKRFAMGLFILTLVESIIVMCLPISYHQDGAATYTFGLAPNMTYVFVGLYFVAVLYLLVFQKKKLQQRRWFSFVLWFICWIVAASVQFFIKELLLVGYATSLGIAVLYVVLENPEINMNLDFACFNVYALHNYLLKLYGKKIPFYLYSFSLVDASVHEREKIKSIIKQAERFKSVYVFKELSMDFLFLTLDEEEFERIGKWIQETVEIGDYIFDDIQILSCKNAIRLEEGKNLASFLQFFRPRLLGAETELIAELTNEMIDEFQVRDQMFVEITNALAEDRVEVFYQPIYSNHYKRYSSAEALVRIRRADGSLIPPGLFIPVAESTGLIVELGERIFTKTCQFLADYKPWKYGIDYIEVNLSVLQCEEETLAQTLTDIMDSFSVEAKRINLEITETATLNAKKKLLKNMDTLIGLGCTFSLDDFGKGESNLMYIVEMPVNIVKLDYDMTKAFHQTPKARSVVRSVVSMAHEMGLKVVAEGIETKEELACMIEQEIDYIQGYYFSRPLPVGLFYELIQTQQVVG